MKQQTEIMNEKTNSSRTKLFFSEEKNDGTWELKQNETSEIISKWTEIDLKPK